VFTILISKAYTGPEPHRACVGQIHNLSYKTSVVQYAGSRLSSVASSVSFSATSCVTSSKASVAAASSSLASDSSARASSPWPLPPVASSSSAYNTISAVSERSEPLASPRSPRDKAYMLVFFLQAAQDLRQTVPGPPHAHQPTRKPLNLCWNVVWQRGIARTRQWA
jgi:hypothetical protein